MPDCMMPFPEDWHDFLKDYSFDDSQEVYTNGSRLIPVFRVEQLIKHLLKAQEPMDAVPVEWLKSKRKEALHEGMRPDEVEAVEMVLWMWQKEQEAR